MDFLAAVDHADQAGTVLVDCFDPVSRSNVASITPTSTRPPSPTSDILPPLRLLSLSVGKPSGAASGSITPQRSFSSDDTDPSSSLSLASCSSSATSHSEDEPLEVLGGGALYALIGARIWLPANKCRTLVDTAEGRSDLGPDLEAELEGYGPGCWGYQEGDGRRMIRARIRYEGTVRL